LLVGINIAPPILDSSNLSVFLGSTIGTVESKSLIAGLAFLKLSILDASPNPSSLLFSISLMETLSFSSNSIWYPLRYSLCLSTIAGHSSETSCINWRFLDITSLRILVFASLLSLRYTSSSKSLLDATFFWLIVCNICFFKSEYNSEEGIASRVNKLLSVPIKLVRVK